MSENLQGKFIVFTFASLLRFLGVLSTTQMFKNFTYLRAVYPCNSLYYMIFSLYTLVGFKAVLYCKF